MRAPRFLLVDPAHFEVAYSINPWMKPSLWGEHPQQMRQAARQSFTALTQALASTGAALEIMPGAPGAPDLVFPANAAVVLDGRAILARFLCAERQVEEPIFLAAFQDMQRRGLMSDVALLPAGAIQEGAGDFIWDAGRQLFWAGYGQRSNLAGAGAVAEFFGEETALLELATPKFYHLDTCFCPLPGGEILYYPPAFTAAALRKIRGLVPPTQRIEATAEDAERFCVNAVGIGRTIIMAQAADRLRNVLKEQGYDVIEIDLAPFILSGGGAYCMTLRLDRARDAATTAKPVRTLSVMAQSVHA